MTSPAAGQPTPLTAPIMRRLAFAQMFFQQSVDKTRQPEPLNVTGVLGLHDAVELYLQIAADHLDIVLPTSVPFPEYFKLLSPSKHQRGVKLQRRREMEGLNNLRVNFKHRGTLPSTTATQDAAADVRRFIEENTPLVFGIAFADIDMAEVIPQAAVRDKVRAANAAMAGGDIPRRWACWRRRTTAPSGGPALPTRGRSAGSATTFR